MQWNQILALYPHEANRRGQEDILQKVATVNKAMKKEGENSDDSTERCKRKSFIKKVYYCK